MSHRNITNSTALHLFSSLFLNLSLGFPVFPSEKKRGQAKETLGSKGEGVHQICSTSSFPRKVSSVSTHLGLHVRSSGSGHCHPAEGEPNGVLQWRENDKDEPQHQNKAKQSNRKKKKAQKPPRKENINQQQKTKGWGRGGKQRNQ